MSNEKQKNGHLIIDLDDHKEFKRMVKKQGFTIKGKFREIVKEMKREEFLRENS